MSEPLVPCGVLTRIVNPPYVLVACQKVAGHTGPHIGAFGVRVVEWTEPREKKRTTDPETLRGRLQP